MQGIESEKHKKLIRLMQEMEEHIALFGKANLSEKQEKIFREEGLKLKATYDYYTILWIELENCIASYNKLHGSVQRVVYPYVRKMKKHTFNSRNELDS